MIQYPGPEVSGPVFWAQAGFGPIFCQFLVILARSGIPSGFLAAYPYAAGFPLPYSEPIPVPDRRVFRRLCAPQVTRGRVNRRNADPHTTRIHPGPVPTVPAHRPDGGSPAAAGSGSGGFRRPGSGAGLIPCADRLRRSGFRAAAAVFGAVLFLFLLIFSVNYKIRPINACILF